MNNPEYNILPACGNCDNKTYPHVEDNTQGFDLGSRLRGPCDIRIKTACDEFPDGCEPDRCSREITITAEELHEWMTILKLTNRNLKESFQGAFQDLRLIDLELLIDKIEKKLGER